MRNREWFHVNLWMCFKLILFTTHFHKFCFGNRLVEDEWMLPFPFYLSSSSLWVISLSFSLFLSFLSCFWFFFYVMLLFQRISFSGFLYLYDFWLFYYTFTGVRTNKFSWWSYGKRKFHTFCFHLSMLVVFFHIQKSSIGPVVCILHVHRFLFSSHSFYRSILYTFCNFSFMDSHRILSCEELNWFGVLGVSCAFYPFC